VKLIEELDLREMLHAIRRHQKEHFIGGHKGILGSLKRFLQRDLGLFLLDDHPFLTTHIVFFYVAANRYKDGSYDPDIMKDLSNTGYSAGEAIGKYVSRLYNSFNPDKQISVPIATGLHIDARILSKDVKSEEYYKTLFNGPSSTEINSLLVMFLAFLNFATVAVPLLTVGDSFSLFKLQYLALYQVCDGLENVRDSYYSTGLLSDTSKRFFTKIFRDKNLQLLYNKRSTNFRNILAHYSLAEAQIPNRQLDPDTDLYGLAEYFFKGCSGAELFALVKDQIARVSETMEEWSRIPLDLNRSL
jgi:hypothetical protein